MIIRATVIAAATALVALASPVLANDMRNTLSDLIPNAETMMEAYGLENSVALRGLSFGDDVLLNPQPLPPRDFYFLFFVPGIQAMLNPQPLPPRETFLEAGDVDGGINSLTDLLKSQPSAATDIIELAGPRL